MNDFKTVQIPTGSITVSKLNPRKHFNPDKLLELAGSIKDKGILQPILVRPQGKKYEIICGERRYRAAVQAGLKEIPSIVRELDDRQVLEIQVIENLQREDVHPLEEAEGYEALMKKHGYKDVKDIAVKVGKSTAYIYGRMKLCELIPENRKLFFEGKLTPSVALLVARVPAELQKEAGLFISKGGDSWDRAGECMSYKNASIYLKNDFMMALKEAPFDAFEKALAGKPACVDCLKRTGNQKDLFPDISGKDICTDPKCFQEKKTAKIARMIERLREKGETVLSEDDAKKIFPYEHQTTPSGSWVDIDDGVWNAKGEEIKYKTMMKTAKDIRPVFVVHPARGDIIQLLNKKDLPYLLKKAGIKISNAIPNDLPKDISKAKKENRIKDAKREFWISNIENKHHTAKSLSYETVILYSLLQSRYWRNLSDLYPGKNVKSERSWTITDLWGLSKQDSNNLMIALISAKLREFSNKELQFLAEKLDAVFTRDYIITQPYLQAMTKEDLTDLARELEIEVEGMDTDKKGELVKFILKNAPKGKVPKELQKIKKEADHE